MKKFLFLLGLFGVQFVWSQDWRDMMYDNSYNFYEVCAAADKYFETHDRDVKGSGWKAYQRWRDLNESKYAPTGDRSQIDPLHVEKEYQRFLKQNIQPKALFGNGWKELGPWRIDSITGHYSVGLGRIEDLYVDPNNANIIYIGSRSGGFWRSTDEGVNWIGTTDTLFASGVNALTARPNNSSDVLINVQNSVNQYSHGVYSSNNGGLSWVQTNFNPTNLGMGGLGSTFSIYELEYHPSLSNVVFVGTSQGIFRSGDDLNSWTQMLNAAEIREIHFHPTDPNVVYAYDNRASNGNRNKVYISNDAGLTWALSNSVAGNNGVRASLSVSAACPDCLFFQSDNGVWKSSNQGGQFTLLSNPGESRGAFVVSDQDTNVMVIGFIDPFVTNDGGLNFQQAAFWYLGNSAHGNNSLSDNFAQTNVYVHADLRAAKSVNGVLYLATDGYLCKSIDDGATWVILSEGTAIRENYTLGISQSNHFCSMIGSQDNGTSILGENDWVEFFGADGMEAIIHPLNPDWMIGSFQYGGRRRTYDRGANQMGVEPFNESGSGDAAWVAPLAYNPNDPFEIYHFSDEVWRSADFGENWEEMGAPASFGGGVIEVAAIAENNTDIIVVTRGHRIERSTDKGVTFTSLNNGLPTSTIKDVAFDPNNDSVMVVVYDSYVNNGNKVFRTTDAGISWSNITFNLNNMPARAVVIDHTDASNMYVGAEIGVYVMAANDSVWTLYNPNLPNMSVRELEINYGSNTLRAATWGRGMWEYTLKDRGDFPAVLTTEISNPPTFTEPKAGIDQFVTSVVSYAGSLSKVYLEWSINAPTFGNVISMSNLSDSTWQSDWAIPSFPEDTQVFFKVFAIGANGDTTETYKFTYLVRNNPFFGLNETDLHSFSLFPNPNSGKFSVDLGEKITRGTVSVLTLDGRNVWSKTFLNSQLIDCEIDLSSGSYFVVVESDKNNGVQKIVVQD